MRRRGLPPARRDHRRACDGRSRDGRDSPALRYPTRGEDRLVVNAPRTSRVGMRVMARRNSTFVARASCRRRSLSSLDSRGARALDGVAAMFTRGMVISTSSVTSPVRFTDPVAQLTRPWPQARSAASPRIQQS
ncbi:hypothetical protein JOF36_001921 [Pseudonocardia parietis]|uniref:Uncharacterized protein n=1 Tax=Pseudonocardia parietis TaxID=570936 RepID=A0ABS4VQN3_9PSEU|nr:hypothetical protein [Pseudonocardia parietis]